MLTLSHSLMRGFPGENGRGANDGGVLGGGGGCSAGIGCGGKLPARPRHFQLKRVVSPLGVTVKLVGTNLTI